MLHRVAANTSCEGINLKVSDQIKATGGRATGFDYLRIFLSISIVAWHTVRVCYGPEAELSTWSGAYRPLLFTVIPSFFALSGFLVAGSLVRVNSLPVFLTLRAMRIFPALCCEVLISALLIGPFLTGISLHEYFSSSHFYAYFLNILGNIHFFLPGVFTTNPTPETNLQLWTIPAELHCYLLVAVLSLVAVTKRPRLFTFIAVSFNIFAFVHDSAKDIIKVGFSPSPDFIVVCFVWAVLIYLNREKVAYSGWLAALSIAFGWFAITWKLNTAYLAPLPIAYLTIYIGLLNPKKTFLILAGDLSYGIYLYGFPVQQSIAYVLPDHRQWYSNLALSLILSGILAWLSWNLVESPVLSRKTHLVRYVDAMLQSIDLNKSRIAAMRARKTIV